MSQQAKVISLVSSEDRHKDEVKATIRQAIDNFIGDIEKGEFTQVVLIATQGSKNVLFRAAGELDDAVMFYAFKAIEQQSLSAKVIDGDV